MKAWFIRRYGGSEVLEQGTLPDPQPGPHDVLIDIRAASVNPIDWKTRNGAVARLLNYDFPLVLGSDLSGEVIAVGSEVRAFQPGDQVYSRPDKLRIGTFAERIAVRADEVAHKPARLDHVQAAAIPLAGLTAWQALVEMSDTKAGHKVFIHAGAGGVGTFAIQLAKHLGARVATTASAPKHALLRSLGADEVIDYHSQDFREVLRDCNMVLASVGGRSLARSFDVVRPGGIVISLADVPDPELAREWKLSAPLRLGVWLLSWPTRRRARARGARYRFLFMHASGAQLATLADLFDREVLRPVVDRVFPFEAVDQAMAYAEGGHVTGKVVISREPGAAG